MKEQFPPHVQKLIDQAVCAERAAMKKPTKPVPVVPMALGVTRESGMNKTEARYSQVLEGLRVAGSVLWYKYEAMTFKLADDTRYTPDFMVMLANREFEAHEVKGARAIFRDDAKVKIKTAAAMFPVRFKVAFPVPKSDRWDIEDV